MKCSSRGILLPFLLCFSVFIQAQDITENELIDLVLKYRSDYKNENVELSELVEYFGYKTRQEHKQYVEEGDRFSSLYVRWALNAPMEIGEISQMDETGCEEINGVERCLRIYGSDGRTRKFKVTHVTLGFVQEAGQWKIGGVMIKDENGSRSLDYVIEDEQ